MKKMLAILMALLMAALLLPAYAEEGDVAEIEEIAGRSHSPTIIASPVPLVNTLLKTFYADFLRLSPRAPCQTQDGAV